jgi:hypothetical protein
VIEEDEQPHSSSESSAYYGANAVSTRKAASTALLSRRARAPLPREFVTHSPEEEVWYSLQSTNGKKINGHVS